MAQRVEEGQTKSEEVRDDVDAPFGIVACEGSIGWSARAALRGETIEDYLRLPPKPRLMTSSFLEAAKKDGSDSALEPRAREEDPFSSPAVRV